MHVGTMMSKHNTQYEFCVHMMRMNGPKRNPLVRIFFVSTSGTNHVYEGIKYWSLCSCWICSISPDLKNNICDELRKTLEQNQYVALSGIIASTEYIESLGMDRLDGGGDGCEALRE